MLITQYLVLKKTNRWKYSSRLTRGSPALASNEIAVKISIEVPEEIFDKPTLEAKISVPKEAITRPVIEASVIDNVEQIIKQNTGFEVKLEVVEKDEEKDN